MDGVGVVPGAASNRAQGQPEHCKMEPIAAKYGVLIELPVNELNKS
jgi:hypothetical protein